MEQETNQNLEIENKLTVADVIKVCIEQLGEEVKEDFDDLSLEETLGYAKEIAGQTRKYWCAIKHQPTSNFHEPEHPKDFIEYGDEVEYKKRYNKEV